MIQLVEVFNEVSSAMRGTSKYTLREVYINPKHVVAVRPDIRMKSVLQEGLLPEDLDERQSFTKVFLDRGQTGIDITVVGEAAIVSKKLGLHNRELLKGQALNDEVYQQDIDAVEIYLIDEHGVDVIFGDDEENA